MNENNICGAKTRSGNPCKRAPMKNGRCNLHGGKSLRGIDSPTFKHGGRSKYLPQRLANSYAELETDTEYTDLRANMRLREVFIREKLSMLDDAPESAELWDSFRKLWNDITKAFANEDYGMVLVLMNQGEQIIDERIIYFLTHKEIRADLAEQRKDSQAISSIEYKGENAVTMAEVLTFVGAVLNLVTSHVNDRQAQSAIFDGIDKLISAETRNPVTTNRLTDG